MQQSAAKSHLDCNCNLTGMVSLNLRHFPDLHAGNPHTQLVVVNYIARTELAVTLKVIGNGFQLMLLA